MTKLLANNLYATVIPLEKCYFLPGKFPSDYYIKFLKV